MEVSRINAITYSEPGEGEFVYRILDPSIDGETYVKKLNDAIPEYNTEINAFEAKKSALMNLYGYYASYDEITGSEFLNEREPKFPSEKPKGFKTIQEAYPEITAERARRRQVNLENHNIYYGRRKVIENKVEEEIKPLKDVLILKWPEFKRWIIGSPENIWYTFELRDYLYLKEI